GLGQRERGAPPYDLRDWRGANERLARDDGVALDEPVPRADLDGIEAARLRKLVHLRLVGKAGLDGTEPAQRTPRRVVRSPADAGEDEPHRRLRQPEAWCELVEVLVKPLRGDVERDAAVLTRNGEPRLRTERGLVLHRELVFAFDDDVGLRRGVAVKDADALEDVALGMQLRGRRLDRRDRVEGRLEDLVLQHDRLGRGARLLDGVRGDDRDRLADEPHVSVREHRLTV